jgi:hypothetical protein
MKLEPIKSSNIDGLSYDGETKTLHVKFKTGPHTYAYEDVPQHIYASLMGAESIGESAGKIFHSAVKGKFKYSKVGDGDSS